MLVIRSGPATEAYVITAWNRALLCFIYKRYKHKICDEGIRMHLSGHWLLCHCLCCGSASPTPSGRRRVMLIIYVMTHCH